MMLLEDFEDESKSLHCRIKNSTADKSADKPDEALGKTISINLDREGTPRNNSSTKTGFTMSGYLNCRDGVLQSRSDLTYMTTNHEEKLDEAVLRDGRVTIHLRLQELHAVDAHRMIRHYFDGETVPESLIQDYELLPATLQGLCQRCTTVKEVASAIPQIREDYRLKCLERQERKADAEKSK